MSPELIVNLDIFAQELHSLQGRLANLHQDTNTAVQPEANLQLATLKELDTVSKTLEIATVEYCLKAGVFSQSSIVSYSCIHLNDKLCALI